MHSRKIQTTYIAEDTVGEVQSFIKAIRRVRYCHGQRLVHRVTGPIVVTTFSLSIPADPIKVLEVHPRQPFRYHYSHVEGRRDDKNSGGETSPGLWVYRDRE
jgi:hypothetical protein